MKILNKQVAYFCDDNTTGEVMVEGNNGERETFYVQTVDGEYRPDLGCWIYTDSGNGEDIDFDDYNDNFSLDEIIEEAVKAVVDFNSEPDVTFDSIQDARTVFDNDGAAEWANLAFKDEIIEYMYRNDMSVEDTLKANPEWELQ